MSRILLVRHGDTKSNSRQRFWGVTDVELSHDGLRQAERLRDYLAAKKIDAVYSSNLKRAQVTAEIIASRHQLDVVTCAELREVNFGELEGENPWLDQIHTRTFLGNYPAGEYLFGFRYAC